MKLGVVGTGYVGLVTAAGFAARGHDVTCVDIDAAKIASLVDGTVPWYEPGLSELVTEAVSANRLRFTTDIKVAAKSAEIMFIAVGTPPNEDGSADTRAVFSAASDIGGAVQTSVPVVIRSTVPIGTARTVRSLISERSGFDCPVLSNPEFLREGKAVEDFENPSRIVIGSDNAGEDQLLRDLYEERTPGNLIITVDTQSAEMSKYASNAFLATKISFMNEIASLCETLGADVEQVRHVMGFDPRIGTKYMSPGIGYGGSCLPKDTQAVVNMGRRASIDMPLLDQVHRVNMSQSTRLVGRLSTALGGTLFGKKIAVWGLAFKAETDDVRGAPSLRLINDLTDRGASVVAYDPMAMPQVKTITNGTVQFAEDMYECVDGADALVIVTEWNEFKIADWEKVDQLMARSVVFDGRNLHDPNKMSEYGIQYYSIGRPFAQITQAVRNGHVNGAHGTPSGQGELFKEEALGPAITG